MWAQIRQRSFTALHICARNQSAPVGGGPIFASWKEWSYKVAVEFLFKIDRRIELLARQPHVCVLSSKVKDIRGLLITRHNRLYYKIKGNKFIILNMYDTRIDPKKNLY